MNKMPTEQDFVFNNTNVVTPKKGNITWKVPSNIALVKYWGKREQQLPQNPSISFTLDACFTITTIEFSKRKNNEKNINFDIFFEGENKEEFKPKIEKFFTLIQQYVPFISNYDFIIKSRNSFPHSSGIASSASGMAALALCIMSLEKRLNPSITKAFFNAKASFLARLGSGSASRSIEGELVVWGKHDEIKGSTDLYGTKFSSTIHKNFKNYHDTILLVD